jgi:hypothetical protein
MPRHDWREADRRRRGAHEKDDYGQADYSRDYGYDPETHAGYRRGEDPRDRDDELRRADDERGRPYGPPPREDRRGYDEARDARERGGRDEPRSWMDRAGDFFNGRDDERRAHDRYEADQRARRRRGPSDRVLWAVIVERLEDERGLDLRDVEVIVDDAEVTLNGVVRRKEEKRHIEDLADIEGVRNVQNNLRIRERSHWTFL